MRLLKLNLLALAVLLFTLSTANAYRVDMTTSYDGSILGISDTISVTVLFDTEGAANVMLLGVGLAFDTAVLQYVPGASSTPTYLLYTTSKNAYLVPASTCSPVCGLSTVPGVDNQVQLDFLSSKVAQNIAVPGASAPGGESLGTYVFHVIGLGTGTSQIALSLEGATGGIFQLGDGSQPPIGLGSPIAVITPEPTTALLIGLGLVGLGVAGRRRE